MDGPQHKIADGAGTLGSHPTSYDELTGWVAMEDVTQALSERAAHTNVVVTGRAAPPELVNLADTVTDMSVVKHAYEEGVRARRGLAY